MDKQAYIHYCNILIDKLDAIQKNGLSIGMIHDIRTDKGLLVNNIANINSNWFDNQTDDWKKEYYEFIDGIIKRVERDLMIFVCYKGD